MLLGSGRFSQPCREEDHYAYDYGPNDYVSEEVQQIDSPGVVLWSYYKSKEPRKRVSMMDRADEPGWRAGDQTC